MNLRDGVQKVQDIMLVAVQERRRWCRGGAGEVQGEPIKRYRESKVKIALKGIVY